MDLLLICHDGDPGNKDNRETQKEGKNGWKKMLKRKPKVIRCVESFRWRELLISIINRVNAIANTPSEKASKRELVFDFVILFFSLFELPHHVETYSAYFYCFLNPFFKAITNPISTSSVPTAPKLHLIVCTD